jgi:RNAse (barnase) inhibitor barstar
MNNWNSIFSNARNSGIFQADERLINFKAGKAARDNELGYTRIALKKITSKKTLLKRLAGKLGFPDYFGGNWDALAEVMQDPGWNSARGRVILFTGFADFSRQLPAEAEILMGILEDSCRHWAGTAVSLFIIVAQ